MIPIYNFVGEQKVHYGSLIEQLIFMEETHRPWLYESSGRNNIIFSYVNTI